jgi:hypothetical protein
MNESPLTGANRREFFRGGARCVLLATIGALSALLFKRSGGKLSGQTCTSQGICSDCRGYASCGLPQALSRKQFNARSSRRAEAQTSPAARGSHAASTTASKSTLKGDERRAREVA